MSAPLVLRTAVGKYDHVRALRDGSVRSERVRLDMVEVEPVNRAFRQMVQDSAFDLSEMALTTHALAHAFGKPVTALPIVLMRGFHHGAILCANGSAIAGPADLAGRKVAVRAYSQTTGVWVRGILEDEHGLDPDAVTWVTLEDAHVREYRDPPNVERAPAGKGLRDLLLAGEVDAVVGLGKADPTEVRTVIPDADKAAAAWYRKTGIYPVNHAVSIRTGLLTEHPWLADELMTLFTVAKKRAREQAPRPTAAAPPGTDRARLLAIVGDDPFPYGMAPNRTAIEMLLEYAARQKLTPRVYRVEELFAAGAMASA